MTSSTDTQPLRDAASALRSAVAKATRGPWEAGERCVWNADTSDTVIGDAADGTAGATTPANADFIAMMDPDVALELAEVLEECAAFNYYDGDHPGSAEHTLARRILSNVGQPQ